MQITLILSSKTGLVMPAAYNYQVQSAIYGLLKAEPDYSEFLHNSGYTCGTGAFKLFTFGRLDGEHTYIDRQLHYTGDVMLEIRSVSEDFCRVLCKAVSAQDTIKLFDTQLQIKDIQVSERKIADSSVVIKTNSPIIAKRNLLNGQTEYYSPGTYDFNSIMNGGFRKKYVSYFGREASSDITLDVDEVSIRKVVTRYKDLWINAYDACFVLSGSSDGLNLLYNTGLGSRNAQGFGMFDIVRKYE